jgi:hypothetical protein
MDLHGNQPAAASKEIQCSDCGHSYRIAPAQQSSVCSACGNVEFLASAPVRQLSAAILEKNILPLLAPRKASFSAGPGETVPEGFFQAPDGRLVQNLLLRYQVEWQLWAMLAKHFHDPAYHSAYLAQVVSDGAIENAVKRYREHRSVMVLSRDSQWQAQVSDLMLERLQGLSLVQMQMEGKARYKFPAWLPLLPPGSSVMRLGWIALGLFLAARVSGWI